MARSGRASKSKNLKGQAVASERLPKRHATQALTESVHNLVSKLKVTRETCITGSASVPKMQLRLKPQLIVANLTRWPSDCDFRAMQKLVVIGLIVGSALAHSRSATMY